MNDDVHGHLDGALPGEALSADDRIEADSWDRMIAAFRTSAPRSAGVPPWLEQRVMAEIDALPEKGAVGRAVRWLLRPVSLRVSPLAATAVVALIGLAIVRPALRDRAPVGSDATGAAERTDAIVYVQFVLDAPGATSVAVAGDFSEWEPTFALDDTDGDGVWTGRVPIRPGVHSYMFLVDGTSWRTDPRADRYQDDGFGNRNAVLAVAAGV